MGVPYEMPPQSGLRVPGGQTVCFAIPFPSRTLITKIILAQVEGDVVDFTLTLFNHESVCAGGVSQSASDALGAGPVDESSYLIAPPFDGIDGKLAYFADANGGLGFLFFSQDKPPLSRYDNQNRRQLYARISAGGAGAKMFCLTLGGMIMVSGAT